MGSKEEDVPTEPAEKPLFVEDMNESELASAVSTLRVVRTARLTRRMNTVVEVNSLPPAVPPCLHAHLLLHSYALMHCITVLSFVIIILLMCIAIC